MKPGWLLAILLLVSSAAAQRVQTSVCEVTRSPASFDGKMVRLRATVASGFEAFGIRDPEDKCGVIWLTYAGGGPVASTSFGPATPNLQRAPVQLKNNRQLKRFQKLLDAPMYPRSRGNICRVPHTSRRDGVAIAGALRRDVWDITDESLKAK